MKSELIKKIINKKIPCYFVSPHFDDAALSAGDLITFLSKYTKVTVVNIFTKAGRLNTLSARKFLYTSGKYKDAQKLFEDRNKEDELAFSQLSIKRVNLDFTDAMWRRKKNSSVNNILTKIIPEIESVYPTYRFHVHTGQIAKEDTKLITNVSKQLKKIIKEKYAIVFCPIGIGNHVDHLITKKACEQQFNNVYFWKDFPYSERKVGVPAQFKMNKFAFKQDLKSKEQLIKSYKTQVKGLFPKDKLNLVPEAYYSKQ